MNLEIYMIEQLQRYEMAALEQLARNGHIGQNDDTKLFPMRRRTHTFLILLLKAVRLDR